MYNYEVTFIVKGIVSLNVNADTIQEAKEIGEKKFNKLRPFVSSLEYLSGGGECIAVTNSDKFSDEI
jgi:hypothetical protein